jgi:predicted  nucleic acid-binding Zn-ribbon protein
MSPNIISIYEGIILLSGLIGLYVKMQNELAKLKNRVYTLEQNNSEVSDMLKQLASDLQEIKLLLARKQIDS